MLIHTTLGGQLLREWRYREHLSQDRAGRKLGLTQSAISGYEGGRKRPELLTAARIEEDTDGAVPCVAWARDGEIEVYDVD